MVSCGTMLLRTHTDVDPEMGLTGIERVRAVAEEFAGSVRIQQVAFPQHGLLSLPGTEALLAAALAAGASVVGGLDPSAEGEPRRYLDVVYGLAERAGAGVDLHLHTHGPAGRLELELIAERTKALGMGGRVVVSHAYCFGDLDDSASRSVAERLADAGVGVVTAAVYNFPVPPLRLLAEAGVVVGCGHDGIRDLWGPYGTGDMLERARQVAYRSLFRRDADIELALTAATDGGRTLLTGDSGGLRVGGPADVVVVPAASAAEAVVTAPQPRLLISAGKLKTP
jgi:cytosine deaminase